MPFILSVPCPSIPYKVPYQLQAQITSINAFNTTMPAYDKRAQVISLTDASTYHQGSYITMMQCIGNSCHNYHGNSWLLNVSSPHVHLCRFHLMMPPAITMSSRLKFNAVRPMPLPTGLVHGRWAERFAKRSKKDLLFDPYHWVDGLWQTMQKKLAALKNGAPNRSWYGAKVMTLLVRIIHPPSYTWPSTRKKKWVHTTIGPGIQGITKCG